VEPTSRRSRLHRRERRTLRALGALLVIAALLSVALVTTAARRDARAASPPTAPSPSALARSTTPLWSPRRIPQIIATLTARRQFAASVGGFAARGRCVAVDGPAGPLVRVDATTPLAGASTQKLLTAAAALHVLGPAHVFTTRLVTIAPISGGVIHGDLVLVGGGDPVLASPARRARLAADPTTAHTPTTALDDLARAVQAAGVHRIDGAIVADDSRYDTLRYLPSLDAEERSDIGPLGALTVDEGITPAGVAAADPALLTAQSLASLLAARGVVVTGAVRRGRAPAGAHTVASAHSPRLDTIVEDMLTVSDNYTAEMLVRAVGLAVAGTGSSAAGVSAVVATLGRLGVPTTGLTLVDGSGLAHAGRITCAALVAAVALGDRPEERALRVGLPIAGRTGTLALRFRGDPLAGRLRAKTGHIDGVVGLAGIVPSNAGELHFAFLANGNFSVNGGEDLQDRLAHLVAGYPDLAALARLVPAP
jgi:D-alanyl-D-alanine carboxypeptidase/D-alanyl-D-alanine-endopeptidase (penicillin-binding protein 4)